MKEFFSVLAIALTLYAFIPYIRKIILGEIKPHAFSWIIWAITTFIVFIAQLDDGGGAGAWALGVSANLTMLIALLSYLYRADLSFTRLDCVFLFTALSSLPFWYLTESPLYAVFILTATDVLGFGPTLRKSLRSPHSESVTFFLIFCVRNILVVLALENYSWVTVTFPSTIAAVCAALVTMLLYLRRANSLAAK